MILRDQMAARLGEDFRGDEFRGSFAGGSVSGLSRQSSSFSASGSSAAGRPPLPLFRAPRSVSSFQAAPVPSSGLTTRSVRSRAASDPGGDPRPRWGLSPGTRRSGNAPAGLPAVPEVGVAGRRPRERDLPRLSRQASWAGSAAGASVAGSIEGRMGPLTKAGAPTASTAGARAAARSDLQLNGYCQQ